MERGLSKDNREV